MKELVNIAANVAMTAAVVYLQQHDLKADPATLAECLRAWVKAKLPEALHDAKEALECHMGQVAEATFRLTMAQAGIEAAKEAGFPAQSQPQLVNA